jgi:hypothetical protein
MTDTSLESVFELTCADLRTAGLESTHITNLVAARLVIERVGDSENLGWWDSLVLGPTGRDRLEEVAEKTHVRARIDLAQKVGRKVESDRLPDDTVSLFSFGPRYESRVEAALDEIDPDVDLTFEALESLSLSTTSLETGWTEPLIDLIDEQADEIDLPAAEANNVLRLEDGREFTEADVEDSVSELLTAFLTGYGHGITEPYIPYYSLTAGMGTVSE